LGFDKVTDPEALAVRKIIDAFPWMVDVADCNFDQSVVDAYILAEAMAVQAKTHKEAAVKAYLKKTHAPKDQP